MVAPEAGDLADERLQRVRVLVAVGDGEVRGDVQGDQRAEGRARESEMCEQGVVSGFPDHRSRHLRFSKGNFLSLPADLVLPSAIRARLRETNR